jgi:hypothetical protein
LSPVSSPYSLLDLHEVVAYKRLRDLLEAGASVAWAQLCGGLAKAVRRRPCEVVVDLHTLRAEWLEHDDQVAAMARRGHKVRVLDLSVEIDTATEGFDLAAAARTPPKDDLAERRARGKPGEAARKTV